MPPPATSATRIRVPRRSLRMRLTMIYAGLFFVSGVGLLAITYLLVDRATGGVVVTHGPGGITTTINSAGAHNPAGGATGSTDSSHGSHPGGSSPALAEQLRLSALHQHSSEMHQFLLNGAFALIVMTCVSIALSWLVAGRILRPLRAITATARQASASTLDQRLALSGPDNELKELGDTFDDLLARLEQSFAAQRQFVANASHEMRSPLTRQRTLVEVALGDEHATVGSLQATNQRVLAAGEQQERLIEALLTLARGQTGVDRRESVNLDTLLKDLLVDHGPEVQGGGLSLETTLAPATLAGDARLIERLATNLLDNGIRHNIAGGHLEVTTSTEAGHAVLAVSNSGPVIQPTEIDRLFQPFQRLNTERTRHDGGLGLGLSIVQAIATAHGASLSTHPRPDGGLEVTVTFAAADARPVSDQHPHPAKGPGLLRLRRRTRTRRTA